MAQRTDEITKATQLGDACSCGRECGHGESAAETMRMRLGLLDGLVVQGGDDHPGDLVVIVEGEQVRVTEVEHGVWMHLPSGIKGNLGHVLRAIAWSYDATDG